MNVSPSNSEDPMNVSCWAALSNSEDPMNVSPNRSRCVSTWKEHAHGQMPACTGSVAKAQDDTLIGPSEVSLNYW